MPDGAAVLQQRDLLDGLGWSTGIPRGRLAEAFLEAAEGGIRRAAEAVDGLVVIAHDHDVVGLVRPPADELEDGDLGHVGVLELVDQDVAELALVAQQQVRSFGQQRDGAQHLLPEIQCAAPGELLLVQRVGLGLLLQAQHVEGLGVAQVRLLETLGEVALLRRRASSSSPRSRCRRPHGGLSVGPLLGGLVATPGVLAADLLDGSETVGCLALAQRIERLVPGIAAEAEGEGLLASRHEVGVLGRRDQLVLGPRDHVGEATQRGHRVALEPVIEEVAHPWAQVAQQQALADAVEQAGAGC